MKLLVIFGMMGFVTVIHLSWGVSLLFSPDPLFVTGLAEITSALGRYGAGIALITASALSLVGFFGNGRIKQIHPLLPVLSVVPQQMLLLGSAWSAFEAGILNSAYADGVERPRLFIGNDQLPAILSAFWHTGAIGTWGYLQAKYR